MKDFIIDGIASSVSISIFSLVHFFPKSHMSDVMDPLGCCTFSGCALQLRNPEPTAQCFLYKQPAIQTASPMDQVVAQ